MAASVRTLAPHLLYPHVSRSTAARPRVPCRVSP